MLLFEKVGRIYPSYIISSEGIVIELCIARKDLVSVSISDSWDQQKLPQEKSTIVRDFAYAA